MIFTTRIRIPQFNLYRILDKPEFKATLARAFAEDVLLQVALMRSPAQQAIARAELDALAALGDHAADPVVPAGEEPEGRDDDFEMADMANESDNFLAEVGAASDDASGDDVLCRSLIVAFNSF